MKASIFWVRRVLGWVILLPICLWMFLVIFIMGIGRICTNVAEWMDKWPEHIRHGTLLDRVFDAWGSLHNFVVPEEDKI